MMKDRLGFIPLQRAIMRDDQLATEILLCVCDDRNIILRGEYNLLELALTYSSSGIVALLLACGIRPRGSIWGQNGFVLLAGRESHHSQDEDDLETMGHHLLSAGLGFYDGGGLPCERAINFNNYHSLRVLLKLGARISWSHYALYLAAGIATFEMMEILREVKIKEFDPDTADEAWMGLTILMLFERREAQTWFVGQTRPTAEESATFRMLINEVRERYNKERLLLKTTSLEDDKSKIDNGLYGKDEEEQSRLPGAWVE